MKKMTVTEFLNEYEKTHDFVGMRENVISFAMAWKNYCFGKYLESCKEDYEGDL